MFLSRSVEKRDENGYLSMKSELIKGLVRRYILLDYPAFEKVPLVPKSDGPDQLDVPAFLTSVLKIFHVNTLAGAWATRWKLNESSQCASPTEDVYAKEFIAIVARTMRAIPSWTVAGEVVAPKSSRPSQMVWRGRGHEEQAGSSPLPRDQ